MSIIDGLELPAGWQLVRFGRLVKRIKETGRPELQPLSVYLDEGVVPRASRSDNFNALGEDLSSYLVVQPGDLVFNKLRTWQGGFGWSRHEGIVSPAYFVCRPRSGLDPRYADYLLHGKPYLAELTRISKWQPPSQFDTPWDELKLLPMLVPDEVEQARIAEFLAAESERIRLLQQELEAALNLAIERHMALVETLVSPLPRWR